MTRRGGREASVSSRGIGEDERQPVCNGELKCCALNACEHGPLWVCVRANVLLAGTLL